MNEDIDKQRDEEMPGFGGFLGYKKVVDQAYSDANAIIAEMATLLGPNGKHLREEKGRYKKLKRELDDLRTRSKRACLLALRDGVIIGSVLAGTGAAIAMFGSKNSSSTSPTQSTTSTPEIPETPETLDKEADTDRLIDVVEKGWENFAQRVEALIDGASIGDQNFKNELISPFKLMKWNKENPNINGPRFHREQKALGKTDARINNPYWFFVESAKHLPENSIAAFEPPTVIMNLSSNFNPNDDIDQLVLYHELRHVAQATNTRKSFTSKEQYDEYIAFYKGQTKRMIVNEEASAYGYEIEILNLLCEGELMQAAKEGRKVNMDIVNAKIKTGHENTLKMLVGFSQYYYPEGLSGGDFTRKFIDKIADEHARKGIDVYIQTTGGGLRKIR